jgi:nitrate/nitrite transporter NarK
MMLALVAGTVVGGQGVSRVGKYRNLAIFFMVIMLLGVLQLVLLDAHSGTLEVLVAMLTMGFGIGGNFPVLIIALQNAFEPRFLGTLNSLSGFFRQIGGTVGISIQGSILTAHLATQVPERMKANLPGPAYDAMTAQGFSPSVQMLTSSEGLTALKNGLGNDFLYNGIITSLREALTNSLHLLFIGSLGISVLALLSLFFLKELPLQWQFQGKPSDVAPETLDEAKAEAIKAAS